METRRLETLKQIAAGVAAQFGSNCEVVIHDVSGNRPDHTIVHIENGHVSGRKVGDGASQVVLDSTRYDSLFFRSNGFVSVVQVLGALALVLAVILFSRRMVKARGFRAWQILLWLLIAIAIAGAGYMEYYVQRWGSKALFAYSVMSACLLFVICLTLFIRRLAVTVERRFCACWARARAAIPIW